MRRQCCVAEARYVNGFTFEGLHIIRISSMECTKALLFERVLGDKCMNNKNRLVVGLDIALPSVLSSEP